MTTIDDSSTLEPTARRKRRRFPLFTLLLAGLVAAVVGAFFFIQGSAAASEADTPTAAAENKADEQAKQEVAIPVEVETADRGAISAYLTASANLVPENEVVILAETEGRIAEVLVEEGRAVAAGTILARLQQRDAEIAVDKARARAANAELAHDRAQRAFADQLVSQEALDKALMEQRVAQQELAEVEWALAKRTVRAPFAGRIVERFTQPGQDIRVGDQLYRLADFDPLVARIYLPERDVLTLREGQVVQLTLAADPSLRFDGRLRQISPVVDIDTGTVKVTVEAVAPPSEVRPGGFVQVEIVRERRPDALLLPKKAVIRELKRSHIFVVDGDLAQRREVELGLEEGDRIEIIGGLERGEVVVTAGQGGLKDGSRVAVQPIAAGA